MLLFIHAYFAVYCIAVNDVNIFYDKLQSANFC